MLCTCGSPLYFPVSVTDTLIDTESPGFFDPFKQEMQAKNNVAVLTDSSIVNL